MSDTFIYMIKKMSDLSRFITIFSVLANKNVTLLSKKVCCQCYECNEKYVVDAKHKQICPDLKALFSIFQKSQRELELLGIKEG